MQYNVNQNVVMFTTATCPYCTKAKNLLDEKGFKNVTVHVLGVDGVTKQTLQEHMDKRVPTYGDVTKVPQIFIDDKLVGGFTELSKALSD